MDSAIEKEPGLASLVRKIQDRFGSENVGLTADWDSDPNGIGIKNSTDPKNLLFISSFAMPKERYFVEVEDSNREVVMNGYVNGELNELNFEGVSEVITKYLGLEPKDEQ